MSATDNALTAANARIAELEARLPIRAGSVDHLCQLLDAAESERNALAATLDRVRAEGIGSVWEAMGELTSYLIDGKHMVDVDDVRRVFERAALAGAPAPEGEAK